jgi:hypothetical protein
MEELYVLRKHIQKGRYGDAMLLIDEMEEMSREDKLNKIFSYAVILLVHLIKQQVEQRSTRSWDLTIFEAAAQIKRVNKRRKSGGYYADQDELMEILEEALELALKRASLEAFEGLYSDEEMAEKVDSQALLQKALASISESD